MPAGLGSASLVPPSDLWPPEGAWSPGLEIGLCWQSVPGGSWPGAGPRCSRRGQAKLEWTREQSNMEKCQESKPSDCKGRALGQCSPNYTEP